jgi:hypothetical protein
MQDMSLLQHFKYQRFFLGGTSFYAYSVHGGFVSRVVDMLQLMGLKGCRRQLFPVSFAFWSFYVCIKYRFSLRNLSTDLHTKDYFV